jgi:hypothetical protein
MGQLDINDRGDVDFVKAIRTHGDGCAKRRVIARKNATVIYNGIVTVCLGANPNFHKVDILWEDGNPPLENFRAKELYGSYRTDYNPMKYDSDILVIWSDNEITIEILF